MASSDYLGRAESASTANGPVLPVAGVRRPGRIRTVAADSLVMAANDVLMVFLAFAIAFLLRNTVVLRLAPSLITRPASWPLPLDYLCLVLFMGSYVLVARRNGLYNPIPTATASHDLLRVMQSCLDAGLLLAGALYMFHVLTSSRALVVLLVVSAAFTLCVQRTMWRASRHRQYANGIEMRNVVILGTNHLSCALARHIRGNTRLGYRVVGFLRIPGASVGPDIPPVEILGGLEKIRSLIRQNFIDEVVIADFYPLESAIRLVEDARELDIDVRAIAGYYGDLTTNAEVEYLGGFPVVPLHRRRVRLIGRYCKRATDLVLSLLALLIIAPLMIVIALAIKLESEGPVFYVSDRIGKRGRTFPCFKFRTMVKNADKMKKDLVAFNERDGVLFKLKNDPRITRLGRFLRKYSFDELPQFLNVLRGEMSIVGPRPPIASEVEMYELEHFRRLEVLPGLTGLWQVQARRDPSFAKYIALDTAYVENWSFWLDLRILAQTVEVVLRGTGA